MDKKSIFTAAREILEGTSPTNKIIALKIPFPLNVDDIDDDNEVTAASNKAVKSAKKQAQANGFSFVKSGDVDIDDECVYIEFRGPSPKLIPWVRKWMRDDDSDEEIIKTYSESSHETIINNQLSESYTYSKFAAAAKVKRLEAGIKSIPPGMVPYVIQIIAAHVSNEQLSEIVEAFKKPTQ